MGKTVVYNGRAGAGKTGTVKKTGTIAGIFEERISVATGETKPNKDGKPVDVKAFVRFTNIVSVG